MKEDGTKERVPGRLDELLSVAPNPWMTSFEWLETLVANLLLWGRHFSRLYYDGSGMLEMIVPLNPASVTIKLDGFKPYYEWRDKQGIAHRLDDAEVLYVRGISTDGLEGLSVIQTVRRALGLSIAAEEFGCRFFGENTHLGGIVEHPTTLGPEALASLRTSLNEKYKGLGQSHQVLILEEGMTWKAHGIPPGDAQFLEQRKFQVVEIARIFGVAPHKLMDLDRATFSNIEHQAMEFLTDTILPLVRRLEQRFNRSLRIFPGSENVRFIFNLAGVARGDLKSRYDAYAVGRQWGWLSVNDVRRMEDMPSIGAQGDRYIEPLNMQKAGSNEPEKKQGDVKA